MPLQDFIALVEWDETSSAMVRAQAKLIGLYVQGPGQQNHGEGGAAAAAQPAAGAPAAAAAGGQQGAGPVGRPRGFVQEVQALFVGFFTSLLPGEGLGFFHLQRVCIYILVHDLPLNGLW